MARTADPHAATVKAWKTRARNAGGGGVVQQRGDFAGSMPRASHKAITDLIRGGSDGESQGIASRMFALGAKDLDLPERALKTLAGIEMATEAHVRKVFRDAGGRVGKNDVTGSLYNAYTRKVSLNANYIDSEMINSEETARIVAHEIGHHVSDWKLKDAAGDEWLALSRAGRAARISKYARQDWQEHFAEAFAAYATKSG